jgi:hypothetical protein
MIRYYLSNKNESSTVPKSKIFSELNKTLVKFFQSLAKFIEKGMIFITQNIKKIYVNKSNHTYFLSYISNLFYIILIKHKMDRIDTVPMELKGQKYISTPFDTASPSDPSAVCAKHHKIQIALPNKTLKIFC